MIFLQMVIVIKFENGINERLEIESEDWVLVADDWVGKIVMFEYINLSLSAWNILSFLSCHWYKLVNNNKNQNIIWNLLQNLFKSLPSNYS